MLLEHGRLLELAADAGVGDLGFGKLGEIDRLPEERGAVVRPGPAGDDVHHRGLASAVGADDAAQLARFDHEVELVERLEAVEAHAYVLEIKYGAVRDIERARVHDATLRRTGVVARAERKPRCRNHGRRTLSCAMTPTTPLGRKSVTAMNSSPRKNSQYSGKATVNQLLAPLTMPAPRMAPTSVPCPPTATHTAISIEIAGDISLGLMMPTCGT